MVLCSLILNVFAFACLIPAYIFSTKVSLCILSCVVHNNTSVVPILGFAYNLDTDNYRQLKLPIPIPVPIYTCVHSFF